MFTSTATFIARPDALFQWHMLVRYYNLPIRVLEPFDGQDKIEEVWSELADDVKMVANNVCYKSWITSLIKVIIFFFLKKLKWYILPTESGLPSTRCTKEETQSLNNIYKGKERKTDRKKRLTYAQHGERAKLPAM